MSSKIINLVAICLFSLCIAGNANAGLLVVGDLYEDADEAGLYWEYVGSFDLTDILSPTQYSYNGIEAAIAHFTGLSANEVALSSNKESDYADIANFLVNHHAFYDMYEGGDLGTPGIISAKEDISTDLNGNPLYDFRGDISANVHDRAQNRAQVAQAAIDLAPLIALGIMSEDDLPQLHINHVFKSVSTPVPEPSTLAIFSLALIGLASRRIKNNK